MENQNQNQPKAQPQYQDEVMVASNPAASLTLTFNLTELPKCGKDNCEGVMIPLMHTTNPKSGVSTVYVAAWACQVCGNNIMYVAGKIAQQTIIKETDSPM